jgi:hypothetical protein
MDELLDSLSSFTKKDSGLIGSLANAIEHFSRPPKRGKLPRADYIQLLKENSKLKLKLQQKSFEVN